jgi:phosphoglycolate phosphatase
VGHLPRLIAFDLDGTLIDSRRDLADSANALVVELGGQPLTEEAVGGMVGGGAALLVRRALGATGIEATPEAVGRFLDIYDARLLNHTRLYDGIEAVVRSVGRRAQLAVLTNKPLHHSERILSGLRVRGLFFEVLGGDGPHPRKPDPGGLHALMAATGADADRTLLVGDSAIDHETARRAGARCCVVSYGIGRRTLTDELLADSDWVAGDARQLGVVLERFLAE